jgi:hypothetical protein
MQVAVMGCVVNGPGESRLADIGISLPGAGEAPVAPVFVDGKRTVTLKGDHIAEEFQALVARYVAGRYGASPAVADDSDGGPRPGSADSGGLPPAVAAASDPGGRGQAAESAPAASS